MPEFLIGAHLFPVWLFGEGEQLTLGDDSANKVLKTVHVPMEEDSIEVLITRMSGLFVGVDEELASAPEPERLAFQRRAVEAFNLVICELCFNGVVSQPASTAELAWAGYDNGVATVAAAVGAYFDRAFPPQAEMPDWKNFTLTYDERVLDSIAGVPVSGSLFAIAPSLPQFVSSAYAFYSRRLLPEALIDAWIAVEQMLNHWWRTEYESQARDGSHKNRLADHRTFSAAVKAEVLLACGALDGEIYDVLQNARKARNDLAHGGTTAEKGAEEAMIALQSMIEKMCDRKVAPPRMLVEEVVW